MTFDVFRDDSDLVKRTCVEKHYLKRWPDPRSLPFAYSLAVSGTIAIEGWPWGIMVFKKPQHHRQRGLFGYPGLPTAWQVLDLARVWINPVLQGKQLNGHSICAFSRMFALVTRQIQRDWLIHHPPVFPNLPYHVELLISYAQLDHHDGTAYRACNFTRLDLTKDGLKDLFIRKLRRPNWRWTEEMRAAA